MTSLDSMKQKLGALGIYRLENGTENALRLSVYAAELDRLFAAFDELLRECFIVTAQSWGIANRERFIGKEKSALTLERRRELLITAEYVTGVDGTPQGFEDFVRSCGAQDFTYAEAYSHARISLIIRDDLDSGTKMLLEERLEAYIPAHCRIEVHYDPE